MKNTFKKKNRFKPFFKPLIKLRENIQNKTKIFKFKKKKWEKFINHFKKKSKFYRKYKLKDQNIFTISKFPIKVLSYKKRYKNNLIAIKRIAFFYGGLTRKKIKKTILNTKLKNNNEDFLKKFEKRIDTILFRSKFCTSIRDARQLISHKKILINKKIVKNNSYYLKQGDFINVSPKAYKIIENNIVKNFINSNIWPLPPKYLTINYKTMEILLGQIGPSSNSTLLNFNFNLNLEKITQPKQ